MFLWLLFLVYLSFYRHGWELFRLACNILITAETVTPAPCDIMLGQDLIEVICIDCNIESLPADPADMLSIPVGNAKSASLIIDEAIKADSPLWA